MLSSKSIIFVAESHYAWLPWRTSASDGFSRVEPPSSLAGFAFTPPLRYDALSRPRIVSKSAQLKPRTSLFVSLSSRFHSQRRFIFTSRPSRALPKKIRFRLRRLRARPLLETHSRGKSAAFLTAPLVRIRLRLSTPEEKSKK